MIILTTIGVVTATTLLTVIMSTSAYATGFTFKQPGLIHGNGCPSSRPVKVTGDNTPILTMALNGYDAGDGAVTGIQRSSCNFAIPIDVLQGFQVSNIIIDWKGYAKGEGQLGRKVYLAGRPIGSWKRNNLNEPKGSKFTIRDNFTTTSSACNGGKYNLRINSQVKAKNGKGYIGFDSVNLNNQIIVRVVLKKC